ncbi:hydrogenase maturation protein [Methylocystis heyeri]|uniref:Hydrogenase maturation protein n=1 Tax=Methylocystis heyeri TaxID=391905 RepID=A0A6B8K9X0_9HYPH|nr:hydrogenase maturation protein [Methylocystis heyeri]QGM44649.1 hydrogenase maturation protein [Methylocystis heyeri]
MRILFLTSAHNSLSQRLLIELTERGHEVRVCVVATPEQMIEGVGANQPDLIVAPMLKAAVPEEVWSRHVCLIVHPGVKGDRGPSSLDWAIATGQKIWGVTILQAVAEMDAGPIWASCNFDLPSRPPSKSSLYRRQVTEAAVRGVLQAIERFQSGNFQPEPLDYSRADVVGRLQPAMRQCDRAIDWGRDDAATIVGKLRAADSAPGVLGKVLGVECFLFGAHEEEALQGPPGEVLARRDGAICIGARDGAVWISHLKLRGDRATQTEFCRLAEADGECAACDAEFCRIAGIKLPAAQVLGRLLDAAPDAPLEIDAPSDRRTYREIIYREEGEVGFLSFDFYNGAMSVDQCRRLRDAFLYARSRPTKVIALTGGADFWSNGIHLNVIEASADPAQESWRNINAIDDLVCEIVNTFSHLVVAGLRGNAGAGGAILALAADRVFARKGVVLNPHYRGMGELYGSEYWTYLLPRRVGREKALELIRSCRPMGVRTACEFGFIDAAFGNGVEEFEAELAVHAQRLAQDSEFWAMLKAKHDARMRDEQVKPLARYRAEELARMRENFFGPDPAYHEARRSFVFKGAPPRVALAAGAASVEPAREPKVQKPHAQRGRELMAQWLALIGFRIPQMRPVAEPDSAGEISSAMSNRRDKVASS